MWQLLLLWNKQSALLNIESEELFEGLFKHNE